MTEDEAFEWNRICFAYADIVEKMDYMDLHIERLETAINEFMDNWDDGGPMCAPFRKVMGIE